MLKIKVIKFVLLASKVARLGIERNEVHLIVHTHTYIFSPFFTSMFCTYREDEDEKEGVQLFTEKRILKNKKFVFFENRDI